MTINKTTWLTYIVFAILCLLVWFHFSLPRFSPIHLTVDRARAIELARAYLVNRMNARTDMYKTAAVFSIDSAADRYLQKTIGFVSEQNFIKRNEFDLFFWVVRFFKEETKEEFHVTLSSQTAEVIGFRHVIDDSARRDISSEDAAQHIAVEFLKRTFHFDIARYTFYTR